MESSLTPVGYCWALCSVLLAGLISVGYYIPAWLTGGYMCIYGTERNDTKLSPDEFCTDVAFGPFRRCGYPRRTPFEFETMETHCGRYRYFSSIPSFWWKLTTVLVGCGSGVALLVALIVLPACCSRNIVTRTTGRLLGVAQFFSGVATLTGCIVYPVGWNNIEVKEVCGENSSSFVLGIRLKNFEFGTCYIGWAYWVVVAGSLLMMVLAGLTYGAGKPLLGDHKTAKKLAKPNSGRKQDKQKLLPMTNKDTNGNNTNAGSNGHPVVPLTNTNNGTGRAQDRAQSREDLLDQSYQMPLVHQTAAHAQNGSLPQFKTISV